MAQSKSFAKKGFFIGIINYSLNLIFPFILRTIIIMSLGNSYVGLGALFISLINVLNVTELGVTASLSFLLYKPMAEQNVERINCILNFARRCFLVIGGVILLIGFATMPFLNYLIASDVPSDINVYILFLITLFNTAISYLTFSYKRILFSADQRYDIEVLITTMALLLQFILQIVLLWTTKNYYLYSISTLIATIFNNILCQIVSRRKYPEYYAKGMVSKEDMKYVRDKVGGAFLSKLSATVYSSVDNIVISALLGLVLLGKFNNYCMIVTSLISAFAIIHNTIRPIIGNLCLVDDVETNFNRFLIFDFLYSTLSFICFACMLALYQDFIAVWIGEESLLSNTTMIFICLMFVSGRISCVEGIYIDALGLWDKSKWVFLGAAVVNLALDILFGYFWGIDGILIATIGSSILITFLGTTIVLFLQYFKEKKYAFSFVRSFISYTAIATGLSVVLYFVAGNFHPSNFGMLIVKGIVVLVSFTLAFLAMNFWNKTFWNSVGFVKRFVKRK